MSKSKTPPLTLISAGEFNRLADTTNLGEEARAMARRVLVDGVGATAAGVEFGCSRQRVHLAVTTIRRAHERDGADSAWMGVHVVLPEALAKSVEHLPTLLRKAKAAKRQEVIEYLETAHGVAEAMLRVK